MQIIHMVYLQIKNLKIANKYMVLMQSQSQLNFNVI